MALWSHKEESFHSHIILRHVFFRRQLSRWEGSEKEGRGQAQLHTSKMHSQANCQRLVYQHSLETRLTS